LTLSRRTRIAVAIALAVAVVTVAAVLLVWPEPPLGERLADSLVDAAGPGGFVADGPCEPQGGWRWLCGIEDDPGSGGSDTYLVELGRDGCWSGARTVDPPGGQPLRGCME
jgi:hypothetical protein